MPRGIFILGESGTGKSFAVREVIYELDGFGRDQLYVKDFT